MIQLTNILNEDLRKWFGKGGEGSTTGGGWDRYNSKGEKAGKCGDSETGDSYAACLSKEKAAKLGKPMQGDVKKFKVYVKNPKTGKIIKVNFGQKGMKIRKSNPAARKSFRARMNCDNPGPRTKANYWSCRKW